MVNNIFMIIIVNALIQLLNFFNNATYTRPIGDQLGVSIILFTISIYSFIYYYQFIRFFKHDRSSVRWTYITVIGGAVLVLISPFNKTPIFYSLISFALLLIYLKFSQVIRSLKTYDKDLFEEGYLDLVITKFRKTRQVVLTFFIILAIILGTMDVAESKIASNQGIAKILSNYFKFDNTKSEKIISELGRTSIDVETKGSLIEQVENLSKELESSYFNIRFTGLILAFLIIVTIIYGLLIRLKVRDLPSNSHIRDQLKNAFWLANDNDDKTGNKKGGRLDNKNLFFISIKIFCLWPTLISALIATHITWQLSFDIGESFLVFLSVFSVTAYGFSLNNIIDRFKDKFAKRKKYKLVNNPRALTIAKNQTFFFAFIAIVSGLYLPTQSLIVILSVLTILTIYSWVNNNYGLLANILTSLCVALLVWVYPVSNNLEVLPNIILLSAFLFLYVLSREIIMDDYDYDSDLKYGKNSLPLIIGRKTAIYFSTILLSLTLILFSFLIVYLKMNLSLLIPVVGASLLSLYGYISYLTNRNDRNFKAFFTLTSISYLAIFGVILI